MTMKTLDFKKLNFSPVFLLFDLLLSIVTWYLVLYAIKIVFLRVLSLVLTHYKNMCRFDSDSCWLSSSSGTITYLTKKISFNFNPAHRLVR